MESALWWAGWAGSTVQIDTGTEIPAHSASGAGANTGHAPVYNRTNDIFIRVAVRRYFIRASFLYVAADTFFRIYTGESGEQWSNT